ILSLGLVTQLSFEDGRVTLHLRPGGMEPQLIQALVAEIRRSVGSLDGVSEVDVHVMGQAGPTAPTQEPLPGVGDILAVSVAKGGVGNSTIAVNRSCALEQLGQRVGLLDADVYGPSLPLMFGVSARPRVVDGSRVIPLEKYGVRLMSMGFFLDDESPVIWRG